MTTTITAEQLAQREDDKVRAQEPAGLPELQGQYVRAARRTRVEFIQAVAEIRAEASDPDADATQTAPVRAWLDAMEPALLATTDSWIWHEWASTLRSTDMLLDEIGHRTGRAPLTLARLQQMRAAAR